MWQTTKRRIILLSQIAYRTWLGDAPHLRPKTLHLPFAWLLTPPLPRPPPPSSLLPHQDRGEGGSGRVDRRDNVGWIRLFLPCHKTQHSRRQTVIMEEAVAKGDVLPSPPRSIDPKKEADKLFDSSFFVVGGGDDSSKRRNSFLGPAARYYYKVTPPKTWPRLPWY